MHLYRLLYSPRCPHRDHYLTANPYICYKIPSFRNKMAWCYWQTNSLGWVLHGSANTYWGDKSDDLLIAYCSTNYNSGAWFTKIISMLVNKNSNLVSDWLIMPVFVLLLNQVFNFSAIGDTPSFVLSGFGLSRQRCSSQNHDERLPLICTCCY